MKATFKGGVNIAIKIPRRKYEDTLTFYRDILGWEIEDVNIKHPTVSRSHKVVFGGCTLWLDCVDHCTHVETWMEILTPNVEEAVQYLSSKGVETCDELEQIPKEMHWITDPAGSVFILAKES